MIEIIMQRLCCGSSQEFEGFFSPLFTLGSLPTADMLLAIEERLHGIYRSSKGKSAYYHGVWSEAHMPAYLALLHGKASGMQQIYQLGLQPEKQDLANLKVAGAGPIQYHGLFRAALSQTADNKGKDLVTKKLIEKCCFGAATGQSESVRYIRAQFNKALDNNADTLAGLVGSCLILGTIPGAPMALPKQRIEFHCNAVELINEMLTILPSRVLWVSLIHVIVSMCDTDPIFSKLRKLYYGLAIHENCKDIEERQEIVNKKAIPALQKRQTIDGSRCRKRVRQKNSIDLEFALSSAVPQKRRLTETTVTNLFPNAATAQEAKQALAPVYRAVLEFAPHHPNPCKKLAESLNLESAQGMKVYQHAVQQRHTLSLIPRHELLQKYCPKKETMAKLCLGCFTLRTKPRDAAANKATEGTIARRDGSEICAACHGSKCVEFCVTPFIVSSLNKHTDAEPLHSQVCSGCGFLAVIATTRGIHPFCASCAKKVNKPTHQKLRCTVCNKVLSKRSHYMQVLCKNSIGHPTEAPVCTHCSKLGVDGSPEPWEMDKIRTLYQSRRHQYAQYAITFRRSGHRGAIIAGRKI